MRQKAVEHFSTAAEGRTPHLRAGPLLPAEEPLIAEAVANTRFDKLRAKEDAEGGFHERPEGCERFFRSGRSGEGQEQLTGDQLQQLEEAFAATLHRFGYGVAASVAS